MNKVRRLIRKHVFAQLQLGMRRMKCLMHFDDLEDAMGALHGLQRRVRSTDFEEWKEDLDAEAEVEG